MPEKLDVSEETARALQKVAAGAELRIKAEQQRCSNLFAVAEQAARLGVRFDAKEAIDSGITVKKARALVMDAAANGDAPETSAIAVPIRNAAGPGGGSSLSTEQKRATWAKAMKRN
jgi:hypothetical protein